MTKFDAAVIGGGLAGLTASVYLARAGLSVAVLEQSGQLGGRAMSVQKGGALFDLGGHGFYKGGAAEQVLKELGVPMRGGVPSAKATVVRGSELIPVPADPATLLFSKHLTGASKLAFIRFMMRLMKTDPARLPAVSFRDWAEGEVHDPMVRHMVYALCRVTSYSPDPDRLLAGPAVRRLKQSLIPGQGLYLDGGWGTLVASLQEQAIRHGVAILNHQHVAAIEHDGAVRQVRTADGTTLPVKCVITTAGPAEVLQLVGATSLREWSGLCRPAHAACLTVALRRRPVSDPARRTGLFLDRPLFMITPSAVSHVSDDGTEVICVTKYLGDSQGDARADAAELEGALDLMQPGWRAEEKGRQFLPRMTATHRLFEVGTGSRYFGPAVPDVPGLYVAGDWAGHGETLVDAAFASARRAAQSAIDYCKGGS